MCLNNSFLNLFERIFCNMAIRKLTCFALKWNVLVGCWSEKTCWNNRIFPQLLKLLDFVFLSSWKLRDLLGKILVGACLFCEFSKIWHIRSLANNWSVTLAWTNNLRKKNHSLNFHLFVKKCNSNLNDLLMTLNQNNILPCLVSIVVRTSMKFIVSVSSPYFNKNDSGALSYLSETIFILLLSTSAIHLKSIWSWNLQPPRAIKIMISNCKHHRTSSGHLERVHVYHIGQCSIG